MTLRVSLAGRYDGTVDLVGLRNMQVADMMREMKTFGEMAPGVRKHLFVWERQGVKKVKKKINFWSGTLPGKLLLLAHYGARKVLFTGLVDCGGVIVHYLMSNGKNQAHPSHHTAKPTRATQKSRRSKLVPHLMFRFQSKQGIPQ